MCVCSGEIGGRKGCECGRLCTCARESGSEIDACSKEGEEKVIIKEERRLLQYTCARESGSDACMNELRWEYKGKTCLQCTCAMVNESGSESDVCKKQGRKQRKEGSKEGGKEWRKKAYLREGERERCLQEVSKFASKQGRKEGRKEARKEERKEGGKLTCEKVNESDACKK